MRILRRLPSWAWVCAAILALAAIVTLAKEQATSMIGWLGVLGVQLAAVVILVCIPFMLLGALGAWRDRVIVRRMQRDLLG